MGLNERQPPWAALPAPKRQPLNAKCSSFSIIHHLMEPNLRNPECWMVIMLVERKQTDIYTLGDHPLVPHRQLFPLQCVGDSALSTGDSEPLRPCPRASRGVGRRCLHRLRLHRLFLPVPWHRQDHQLVPVYRVRQDCAKTGSSGAQGK
jgi:hypothetical protein